MEYRDAYVVPKVKLVGGRGYAAFVPTRSETWYIGARRSEFEFCARARAENSKNAPSKNLCSIMLEYAIITVSFKQLGNT